MDSQPAARPIRFAGTITPGDYARHLLDTLGLAELTLTADDQRPAAELWAQSGAMWLTGHPKGAPRACPAPLAACAQGTWLALASLLAPALDPRFDACRLLAERAAIAGLQRRGRQSPGAACTLLDCADGVIALNLARADDWELLPAWLQGSVPADDMAALAAAVAGLSTATLVERARLLGLAVAPMQPPRAGDWFHAIRVVAPVAAPVARPPLVIDLSSLWAGPLCGQLLAAGGARVIKVESTARPDGARLGPQAFFDLMNAGKESVALDLRQPQQRHYLQRLLQRADIVIESSRPRGLQQMGIDAATVLRANPGMVWLSITGYGRREPMANWIAYGDDAGVAAGLSWLLGGDRGDPVFCGDAIADPLTGLHAALLATARWRAGGGELLDVPLAGVVAHCVGAGCDPAAAPPTVSAARPIARAAPAPAAALGRDSDRILAEFLAMPGVGRKS